MSRRSRAREIVLQVLYQQDMNPDYPENVRQMFLNARLNRNAQLIEFAEKLIRGIRHHRDELDRQLAVTATNWKLTRMAVTDRNVLRLGAFEILYSDTPDPVAVNEAIELAKRYGTNNSSQFVNGILDRLIKHKNSTDDSVDNTNPSDTDIAPADSDRGQRNPEHPTTSATPEHLLDPEGPQSSDLELESEVEVEADSGAEPQSTGDRSTGDQPTSPASVPKKGSKVLERMRARNKNE